jgi:hypothetical protein
MNVIDSKKSSMMFIRKVVSTFRHHAPAEDRKPVAGCAAGRRPRQAPFRAEALIKKEPVHRCSF